MLFHQWLSSQNVSVCSIEPTSIKNRLPAHWSGNRVLTHFQHVPRGHQWKHWQEWSAPAGLVQLSLTANVLSWNYFYAHCSCACLTRHTSGEFVRVVLPIDHCLDWPGNPNSFDYFCNLIILDLYWLLLCQPTTKYPLNIWNQLFISSFLAIKRQNWTTCYFSFGLNEGTQQQ